MKSIRSMIYVMVLTLLLGGGATLLALSLTTVRFGVS